METLRVFVFSPGFGLPTLGPFALKLEAWLQMANLDYERVYEDDSRKGPKGKSPWVEIDGEPMADTELIIERLSREHGVDVDEHLTDQQRATATAITRMVEEHLHQVLEWELFVHDDGWMHMSRHIDGITPVLMRGLIKRMLRGHFRKQLYARGVGRHDPEIIAAKGIRDLKALATLIGDGPYLFGAKPSYADAAVFGQLGVFARFPADAPAMTFTRTNPILRDYVERMLETFFADSPVTSDTSEPQHIVNESINP